MRELTSEEAKKIELDILIEIDDFCKKNNLRYFLAYGTLIGAVRHKGFIPWDDDIDINMPREDYNWLIENYNKLNLSRRYKIISPYSKEAKHSFAKFIDTNTVKIEQGVAYCNDYLGVDVDIFPLDGEPESECTFDKWYDSLMRVYKLYSYCLMDTRSNIKRRIAIPIIRILAGGKNRLLKKAAKLHQRYPYSTSKYIGAVESAFNSRGNRFEKKWFESSVSVEFEGYMLQIPIEYDKILTKIYGDYMELPPVEKQITHHSNKMYIKDDEKHEEI